MSKDSSYQRVRSHLSYLGLGAASERLAPALEAAEQDKPAYADFLDQLLGEEVEATERRRLERRLRLAGFPHQKTLDQFDFSAQPGLDRSAAHPVPSGRLITCPGNSRRVLRLVLSGLVGMICLQIGVFV